MVSGVPLRATVREEPLFSFPCSRVSSSSQSQYMQYEERLLIKEGRRSSDFRSLGQS